MNRMKNKPFNLAKSFLLGAASSAHQVEGNNTNSDWWHFEQTNKLPRSGQAAGHYNRYAEDFSLAKNIGLNSMRISIEWARIEPSDGVWDMKAVEHYRTVLKEMKQNNLVRMVTLHHYTLPQWIAQKKGFHNKKNIKFFKRYCSFIAEQLGDEIDLWITINEPEVFTLMSSLVGIWPPFKKNPWQAWKLFNNLALAHKQAYKAIKQVRPKAQISVAKNNVYSIPFKNNWLDKTLVTFNNWFGNYWFLNKIEDELDFIGLNYYFYHSLHLSWSGVSRENLKAPKSNMGWRTYPKGIYYLALDLHKRYDRPIYITENGIANASDPMRQDFIREHLFWISHANNHGADIRGYFYWSLTDTYEWSDGFDPKFGLIEVNFETQKRTIRPSSNIIKQIRN